jgi:acetylornithine/succinyldiaminopimelate/putrescine aminotransferase
MENCVVHSSTFGQGAFAMAAGLATLHVFATESLLENAQRMGQLLMRGLEDLKQRFELIHDVRGRGLMVGIEFGRPRSFTLKVGWDLVHKVNRSLFGQAIVIPLLSDHRILTQVAGHGLEVVKLIPPLVITDSDVNWFLEAFEKVVERSHRFPGPIWEVTSRLAKHALKT